MKMDTLKVRRAYAGESLRQKARRLVGRVARVVFIITLIGSGVLTGVSPILAQAANVTVAITAPDTVIPGSYFTANVTISQVQNFDAANFDVSFNPAVLRLGNVTSGNIDGVAVPVEVWNQREPGRFTIVVNIPGLAGASGSGYLAVLRFSVVGSAGQSSNISLSNGVLSNNLALEIGPAIWVGDSVSVISVVPGGQGLPPAPPSLPETTSTAPETTSNESGATSTVPETTTTQPEVTTTELEATATTPEVTTTEPDATAEKELPPATTPLPSETTAASEAAPAPPPPPAAKVGYINWPVVGGAIGGGIIVIGLIIFFLVRRRSY